MPIKAVWNGKVLAESDRTTVVEGNHDFPPESLSREYFTGELDEDAVLLEGRGSYYTVTVDGVTNPDAAWYYPKPSPLARKIKNQVALWNGAQIIEGGRLSHGT